MAESARLSSAEAEAEAVGFDGLAGEGWEAAAHLARAGHALVVHDDDAPRAHEFARTTGARVATDRTGLAALGVIVFAAPAVPAVSTHARIAALVDALHPGTVVIDLGDSDPVRTRELGSVLAHRGVVLIDAPLCGGVGDAGPRTIVHGCDDESALDVALPVLHAMGHAVVEAGALGCGQAMRLVEANVHASVRAAVSEALLVGDRIGLAPESLHRRIEAAVRRGLDPDATPHAGTPGDNFTAGLALGLFARRGDAGIAMPAHAPGLTRLLIEFTTPLTTKETL